MELVNVHEAKTHLSRLIQQVLQGEEVVIGKAGQPLVRLVPYQPSTSPRTGGQLRGQIRIAEDFDELPAGIQEAFEGRQP